MRCKSSQNSFQKHELEISGLAGLYFKARCMRFDINHPSYTNKSSLMSIIQRAYSSLIAEERIVINNEFFYQSYPGWWKKRYSPRAFHKLKERSMSHFLEAFYREAI